MANLEWNGPEAKRRGERAMVDFLHAASIAISNRAKQLLSISGTGMALRAKFVHSPTKQDQDRVLKKMVRRKVYGLSRSAPGEPPFKQTGRLRASVTHEVDERELKARIGTNVEYGKYLELGTNRWLKPRPWLRRASYESASKIIGIAANLGVHFS